MDRRELLTQVFRDTQAFCRENETLARAVEAARRDSVLYGPEDCPPLPEEGPRTLKEGRVEVSRRRSFEAAMEIRKRHPKARIAVLNFASAVNPGGGVKRGSGAQEECLCRCSTLYPALDQKRMWDGFYGPNRAADDPLHTDACIYTPGVVICKSDEDIPKRLCPEEFVTVDVITCAAPDLRPAGDGTPVRVAPHELYHLLLDRARQILSVAVVNGVDALVLGAFGCGAFCNDPKLVSFAFFIELEPLRHRFDLVEFAVYCPGEDTANYDAFSRRREDFLGDEAVCVLLSLGEEARKRHGKGYGSQLVRLTTEQLWDLRNGEQLAIVVNDEYVLFLQGPTGETPPEKNG